MRDAHHEQFNDYSVKQSRRLQWRITRPSLTSEPQAFALVPKKDKP